MKKFIKPILLVVLAAILVSLTILPVPSHGEIKTLPGVQVDTNYGWTCMCPQADGPNCGCVIIILPKD